MSDYKAQRDAALQLLQEILDDEETDGEFTYTQLDDDLRDKARTLIAEFQSNESSII